MAEANSNHKNDSTLSTVNYTHYHSTRAGLMNPESRPKTAHLIYANKPHKK